MERRKSFLVSDSTLIGKALGALCLLSLFANLSLAKQVSVYSYHIDPPFYLEGQSVDLTRAFVAKLNKWQDQHTFQLMVIDRPSLNQKLIDDEPYLILWANPLWFKSKDPQVSATTNIFWDADIWVSHKDNPIKYSEPTDLIGKRIGGRNGYFYKGVTPLIRSGKTSATLKNNDDLNYTQLIEGNIDAFVMSRSSYLYWKATNKDTSKLVVSLSPHDAYKRHLLVSKDNQDLIPLLNDFIVSLKSNTKWNRNMKVWGVGTLVDPIELDLDELMDY